MPAGLAVGIDCDTHFFGTRNNMSSHKDILPNNMAPVPEQYFRVYKFPDYS
jgi:hypothetical protein